ncbi:MAG: hypothetical protein AB1486_00725 [Planctomycetota bacterium]
MILSLFSAPSLAQNPETSFWVNKGNGSNPDFNPELGEFHNDIGGHLEFGRYVGLPYGPIRASIEAMFFDYEALSALLGGLQPPVYELIGSGTTTVWYLPGHPISWEMFTVNGAGASVVWDSLAVAANPHPHLFITPGLHKDPHSDPPPGDPDQPPPGESVPPADWWEGRPLDIPHQMLRDGHYRAGIGSNRGPSPWLDIQRTQDLVRYLREVRGLEFEKVFVQGGSWEATVASRVALLAPKWCKGVYHVGWPDFAFEMPYGGFQKLLMSFYTALGVENLTPIPARGHSINAFVFGLPMLRSADLMGNWEYAAFSILQRKDLGPFERLQRPIHGPVGNCDIYHNLHFFRDAFLTYVNLRDFTANVIFLQLFGHGGDYPDPETNRVTIYTGQELAFLVGDPKTDTYAVNPSIHPSDPAPSDPYLVDVYAHTLREEYDGAWSPSYQTQTLLTQASWVPHPPQGVIEPVINGPIGCGVYPGAYDSLRVGQFDGDSSYAEVVLGNFDGCVEVLEQRVEQGEPILVSEYHSPQVGWGIQALDVGELQSGGGKWIVFGTAAGKLFKIQCPTIAGTPYPDPVPFADNVDLGGGFLQWLFIGDFVHGGGNEVLVQNQFAEWFLISDTGAYIDKTDRDPDPGGNPDNDNFDGGSGKPWVGYWPPRFPTDAMQAFAPGLDGRLRNICWDTTLNPPELRCRIVSDDYHAMGRCALLWNPGNGCGPYIVVGGLPGKSPPPHELGADGFVLTVIDPMADLGTGETLVAGFDGDPFHSPPITLSAPVTLEKISTNEILVVHGNKVTRVQLSADPQNQCAVTFAIPTGAGEIERDIPGIFEEPPDEEQELFGALPEICGVERFTWQGTTRYYVPCPNGRIWILNSDLSFARTTATLELPPGGTANEWYSNRSLGHTFTVDQAHQGAEEWQDGSVWVEDLGFVYWVQQGEEPTYWRRLARVLPQTGDIDDYYRPGQGGFQHLGMTIDQQTGARHKFHEVGDIAYRLGTAYEYTVLATGRTPVNGFIWEWASPQDNRFLQNFDVPVDTSVHTQFPNGTPWPWIEDPRLHGQVTAAVPDGQRPYGNSIKMALLPRPLGGPELLRAVVGTIGGFVYAVDVTAPPTSLDALTYFSHDLGWCVVGLDVGDIDGDGQPEILAGIWLDKGDIEDWEAGNAYRNSGQLVILELPSTPNNYFIESEIHLALESAGGPGPFGAGVFGVKIDDIDGDGNAEIWCTDARGYLHALWHRPSTGEWECFWRTEGLGMYAGMYNKIYVYPEVNPQTLVLETKRLVVHTPGYVYRFEVDPGAVPHENP